MSSACAYCGYEWNKGHNRVCVMNDIARLEAEIERLTALNRRLVSGDLDIIALCESEQRLEAEIERLRAGK